MAEPHRESGRKGVASFKGGSEAAGSAEGIEQLVVTFNATMGEIVKLEKVDKAGKREELTEEDCARLAGEDEVEEIEAALGQAFEAGVALVLGDARRRSPRRTMTRKRPRFDNFSLAHFSNVTLSGAGSCINCSCAGCSCAGSSNVGFDQ